MLRDRYLEGGDLLEDSKIEGERTQKEPKERKGKPGTRDSQNFKAERAQGPGPAGQAFSAQKETPSDAVATEINLHTKELSAVRNAWQDHTVDPSTLPLQK